MRAEEEDEDYRAEDTEEDRVTEQKMSRRWGLQSRRWGLQSRRWRWGF